MQNYLRIGFNTKKMYKFFLLNLLSFRELSKKRLTNVIINVNVSFSLWILFRFTGAVLKKNGTFEGLERVRKLVAALRAALALGLTIKTA